MKEVLYILSGENDINQIKNLNNICFSLCPMVRNRKKLKILYPDPIKSYELASEKVLESQKIFNQIISLVNKSVKNKEKKFVTEILMPYLEVKISIYLYLKNILPKSNIYKLLIKSKWKNFYSLDSLIIGIEAKYSKEKGNIHNHLIQFTNYKYSFIKKFLSKFQVHLINQLINQKPFYLLSNNKSYFMPNIFLELRERKKNIIVFNESQKISIMFFILFKQIFSILFFKNRFINEFFILPILSEKKIKLKNHTIENRSIGLDYLSFLINDIERYINIYRGYKLYNYKLFKKCGNNQIQGVFHTNRFPNLNSLSFILYKLKQKQHLISHGTHTLQKLDKPSVISCESLAVGMIKSKVPNINIYSQSKFSDDYLTSQNLFFNKIKPINFKKNENINDSKYLNILSAGTVKQLGCRRHYFESSFEYIYSINKLANQLRKLDFKVKLILRIRDVNHEINARIKNEILNKFDDIIELSETKKISEDICKSDCLIALSSTTLEEAINHNIPSMSYGLSKYDHFSSYYSSNFQIPKNIKKYSKLRKVEKLLNKKFVYLNKSDLKRRNNIFDFIL